MTEQVRAPEELGRALLEISRALLGAFGALLMSQSLVTL